MPQLRRLAASDAGAPNALASSSVPRWFEPAPPQAEPRWSRTRAHRKAWRSRGEVVLNEGVDERVAATYPVEEPKLDHPVKPADVAERALSIAPDEQPQHPVLQDPAEPAHEAEQQPEPQSNEGAQDQRPE